MAWIVRATRRRRPRYAAGLTPPPGPPPNNARPATPPPAPRSPSASADPTPATGSASQQTIIAARATAGLRRTTRSAAGSGLPRATSADQAEPFRAAELAEPPLVQPARPPSVHPEAALPWGRHG